jgi:zinc protease
VKRRPIFSRLIGVVLMATACLFAHAEPEQNPQGPTAVELDPAVRHGWLSNGIEYLILQNHEPKGRVSLRFAVKAGSLNETEEQRGLAHYLEHMAFNGSTHFAPGTLVEYLQRLGMGFGADTNAFTSFDRTEYLLELPDTRPETIEKGLTLFADYGDGLFLTEKAVDKERGIILSEERMRNTVTYRAEKDELKFLMPQALIPERMPIGLTQVIEHATREQIKAFYDAWYRPENFVVAVVGDIDAGAVEGQLKTILSGVKAHGSKRPDPDLGTIDPGHGLIAHLHSDLDAGATTAALEAVSPWAHEPDTADRRIRRLKRDLALMMLNRRLEVLANKDGAAFSRASAEVDEQFDFVRSATIQVTGRPENWRSLLGTADQELRRVLEYGFQPAELAEAVAAVRNNLEQAVRSAATRPSRALADDLVNSVIDHEVFTTPAADLALLGPALDKVTPEDCRQALRAVWPERSGRYLYVSGNLRLAAPAETLASAYDASSKTPVSPPEPEGVKQFAYTDFRPPGQVVSRRHIEDLDVTLVEFSNGVRLNLKRTDFEAGRIAVNVRIGAGRLTEPPREPGLSLLAENTFEAGGLGKLSRDDLERVLAGRTVGVAFHVQDDAFVLQGETNPSDLSLELRLLDAYVTDPGYRPEAARQFEKGTEQFYSGLAHDVRGPLQTEVPRLLSTGDTRFGIPPESLVQKRTLEELRAWLTPQFASGPIEIAIVGDLDVDATIAAVAHTFGAMPLRSAKPPYTHEREVLIPSQPASRSFSVSTDIPRGIVELRWPATDRRKNVHLARRLQLLASILSDRLRVTIREKMGATYSPNARADLSETFTGYGFIEAQSVVAPEQAQAVAAAIKAVAADLAKNGVTADELERARGPLMTAVHQSLRENGYWLNTVLASAQENPERLEWARDRVFDYKSITTSQLSALAAEYLSPSRAFEFISIPAT